MAAEISHTAEVEFVLSIDVTEQPPCGQIIPRGGSPVGFVGWLGLLRCLSDLVESAPGQAAASGLESARPLRP